MATDRLWAPWRLDYIQSVKDETACVFCRIRDSKKDADNLVLLRGKYNYVVLNRYPYCSGHLMVVSNDHTGELKSLSTEAHHEILSLMGDSMEILKESIGAQGFNCGVNMGRVAGAGILDHFHFHVVPRWAGDNNFMPVLADTKTMPEYLEKTYAKLAGGFQKL